MESKSAGVMGSPQMRIYLAILQLFLEITISVMLQGVLLCCFLILCNFILDYHRATIVVQLQVACFIFLFKFFYYFFKNTASDRKSIPG